MFRFFCTNCNNKLKAPKSIVGKKVECAHCGTAIVVPEPDSVDSAELNRFEVGKTQQLSRKALIDHSTILEPETTANLVDLINQQVEEEESASSDSDQPAKVAIPEPPPPPQPDVPPRPVAMPVEVEQAPPIAEPSEPPPHKVAVPVEVEEEPPIAMPAEPIPHKVAVPVEIDEESPVAMAEEETSERPVAEPVEIAENESVRTGDDEAEEEELLEEIPPPPADPVVSPNRYRAGTVIGNFEIGYLLGEGAMGQVFSAKQLSMDRQVALKILPPEIMNEEAVTQFNNEVRMLAKLSHQNIVTAYEAGEDKGIYYLAMAFIEGMALDTVLDEEGSVPEEDAINLIIYVATALKYAWDQYKMIHLDIKPSNIMIDSQGTVKLMDLGIAKIPTGKEGGQDHTVLGTPRYMSPEQASGQPDLDWRSDQYSLGATLYHMLTGEPPFHGDDPTEVMNQQVSAPLRPPISLNDSLSKETSEVVKRMMAKSREKRFESWDDLITRLGEISLALSNRGPKNRRKAKGTDKNRPVKAAGKKTRMRVGRAAVAYGHPKSTFGSKLMIILFLVAIGLILLAVLMVVGSKG